ncbi:hypothetical protein SeMB42_g07336 [Synchytrium endobioticum]|uniref:Uncharacterized protein n=1 Tax=Synchytrium endobioticum TaxID=286115 RepID=A0A507CA41_9FUNG|nr:hypothetical protein SeMB42_g07336 [Synchytrium endobioticum]
MSIVLKEAYSRILTVRYRFPSDVRRLKNLGLHRSVASSSCLESRLRRIGTMSKIYRRLVVGLYSLLCYLLRER